MTTHSQRDGLTALSKPMGLSQQPSKSRAFNSGSCSMSVKTNEEYIMRRRSFLKFGLSYAPATLLPVLPGCGGGNGNDVNGPICLAGAFATGLQFAPSATLRNIAPVTALALQASASSSSLFGPAPILPSYFNLTDANNIAQYGFSSQFIPGPGEQGRQGSCVAWGTGYAMSSFLYALSRGTQAQSPGAQASPSDLYSKILQHELGNPCNNGTLVKDALDVLTIQGVASLAAVPYTDIGCVAPSASSQFSIDSYHRIDVNDSAAIKTALYSFRILPIGFSVYQDFENLAGAAVYSHPTDDQSCPLGGHCVALVGYDDSRGAYRVQNSWGTAWADIGRAWIAYDTFNRIVSEVYSPYIYNFQVQNTLIPSPSSTSGSIRTLQANTRSFFDTSVNGFRSIFSSFLLSDAIRLRTYQLRYYSSSNNALVKDFGPTSVDQIVRGSLFDYAFPDDTWMRTPGYFAMQLVGTSAKTNENVNLTIGSTFPTNR